MTAALALGLVSPALAGETLHQQEIAAWAGIMADVRTAAEYCRDVRPDQTALAEEMLRLHIADVDYFAFRSIAHDRAETMKSSLAGQAEVEAWCRRVITERGNLLKRPGS